MHRTQLQRVLDFLDAYHPADPTQASLVSALARQARNTPTPGLLHELACQVDRSPFRLRRTIRLLPGLAQRIRDTATEVQT